MKAKYTYLRRTITGKIDNFVHLQWKDGNKAVIRRYVKPKSTENNHKLSSIMKNSAALWKLCSSGFRDDLKIYANERNDYYSAQDIPAPNNFSHFLRFLYNFADENPEIDLKTITKAELETAGIPTKVKDIVAQSFLPPIPDASELINNW